MKYCCICLSTPQKVPLTTKEEMCAHHDVSHIYGWVLLDRVVSILKILDLADWLAQLYSLIRESPPPPFLAIQEASLVYPEFHIQASQLPTFSQNCNSFHSECAAARAGTARCNRTMGKKFCRVRREQCQCRFSYFLIYVSSLILWNIFLCFC